MVRYEGASENSEDAAILPCDAKIGGFFVSCLRSAAAALQLRRLR